MEHQKDLVAQLRPVSWANIVYTSAKTGQRLPKVLDAVAAAGKQHRSAPTTMLW
jgi:predicted GTPase